MRIFGNRSRLRAFTMGVVLAGIIPALSGPALAQSKNLVYVQSNIGSVANMNSVFVYSNDGAGNLTQIAGSPFLTNGTGWYDPTLASSSIDTDHALIIDPTGSFLYTVNAHSNTISGFAIGAGGVLTQLTNSPFGTGDNEPESLALVPNALHNGDSVLAVANKDNDPNQEGGTPTIRTAITNSSGVMSQVKGGKISFAAGDYLGSVNATPLDPGFFYALQLSGGSEIISYKIGPLGKLEVVSSIGPPNVGDVLLGMAFHPTQRVMYVGVPSADMIAVYLYSAANKPRLVTEVSNPGNATCWYAMNAAGTRLYSSESGGGTVTVYDTTNATSPVQLQHVTLSNQPQRSTDIKVDPTGKFLYVLGGSNEDEMGSPFLHVFSISQTDGTLTELNPVLLPVPPLEHPQGLAVLMK